MKLAAIDIGTNSVHMVVVEITGPRSFHVIDREKTMVRLGAELFGSMRLSERAFSEGLEALKRYFRLAESRGVDEILAVATAATREAENGTEFLDAIFRETGLMPRVISGSEEGRLIFLAVTHALDLEDEQVMVIDIGGGSVEVSVGQRDQVLLTQSLRLGVLRLLHRVGGPGPLSMRAFHELQGYVQGVAADVMGEAKKLGYRRVIGTSGTIRALGEAAHLASGGAPFRALNAQVARRKDIKDLARKLMEMDPAKRARVPGVVEQRADSIHVGGVLLSELLDMAERDEITLCDASLREGVIWDYLDRHIVSLVHAPLPSDPRRRSVVELARKYERDDPREQHIAALALSVFDQTVHLHGYGAEQRELLEYAALLHGIGRQIGYRDREKHSRYLIRNSALRGFTEAEIELLSLIVLFHRGPRPRRSARALRALEKPARRALVTLSAFLRLAVALDRGHSQLVRSVTVTDEDSDLRLTIDGPGDLYLELFAARDKLLPLSKALRRRILLDRARGAPTLGPVARSDEAVSR